MQQTGLTDQQADYLNKMQSSSRLLLGIIDDILDVSKIEAGKLQLNPIAFRLNDVLQQVTYLLEEMARQKGLTLTVNAAADVPMCLVGDPQRLAQILLNLVNNALKFTEHGDVRVSIECLSHVAALARLQFKVVDTGMGMSAEQQQKLFQPFSQVDTSFSRRHGGSGLGLVISQSLAQLMGGTIALESQVGQGSTFCFTADFPTCMASALVNTSVASIRGIFNNVHVLLVEDDVLNQMIAGELLKQLGVSVTVANNGFEALAALEKTAFHLIFMDIQMPQMDGYEAVKRIRQQPTRQHVPIIAMTAHAISTERERCLAAGMDDYLTKPIDIAGLAAMLSKWTVVSS
jgi:CheY-like chemotaxis protein